MSPFCLLFQSGWLVIPVNINSVQIRPVTTSLSRGASDLKQNCTHIFWQKYFVPFHMVWSFLGQALPLKFLNCQKFEIRLLLEDLRLGVVEFFKVPFVKCFSTGFGPKVTDLPSNFPLTLFWSCKAASKSEAPKSTLLYKSCSNQKILADLLYQF